LLEEDIIGHLIDVEHQASSMVFDAQVEADQRIADARAKADVRYKELYDDLVNNLEIQTAKKIADIKKTYDQSFVDFSDRILQTPKDIPAFEEMLNTLLFKAD